jgi:hypothetical protein
VPSRVPEIAVQHSRASLQVLAERHPGAEARVLARLPPEAREALVGAARSDFLPARVDVALAAAIVDELGLAEARRVARAALNVNFEGSLLGALDRSAQVLFGGTPAGLLRWAGQGWRRVCRDCGELRLVASAADSVTLRLEGLLDICRVEGAVVVERRPDGAWFQLTFRPRSLS